MIREDKDGGEEMIISVGDDEFERDEMKLF